MKIEMLRKKDYQKVIDYAIKGMHFDWYMSNKFILNAYGRYFLYMSLNRATQVIAAYEGDELAGVLLADIEGEDPAQYSVLRNVYVKMFDFFQRIVAGKAVGEYEKANNKMLENYKNMVHLDGELIFLAANPEIKGKGTGTVLLEELKRREAEKRIYLFTDSGCTYQFYEHRGFDRVEEEHVVMEVEKGKVPLDCYLYSIKL